MYTFKALSFVDILKVYPINSKWIMYWTLCRPSRRRNSPAKRSSSTAAAGGGDYVFGNNGSIPNHSMALSQRQPLPPPVQGNAMPLNPSTLSALSARKRPLYEESLGIHPQQQLSSTSHRPAMKPFESLTFTPSPFHIFHTRLYTKVVDGRSCVLSIPDFKLLPSHIDLLQSQPGRYAIKLLMANPQMALPFGDPKVIDPFYSDSCYVTVNSQVLPSNVRFSLFFFIYKIWYILNITNSENHTPDKEEMGLCPTRSDTTPPTHSRLL